MIEHITDLVVRAQSRLLEQYRSRPNIRGRIAAVVARVQEVEDALFDMVAKTAIDTADGVWLDRLGLIVNEPREGASDADYRGFLRARVLANRSLGTVEDVLAVMKEWNGGVMPSHLWEDFPPAAFALTMLEVMPLPDGLSTRLVRFLRTTRAAGIGLMILWQPVEDAESFTFSSDNTEQASTAQGWAPDDQSTGGQMADAERA